jgi:hypothetical protein
VRCHCVGKNHTKTLTISKDYVFYPKYIVAILRQVVDNEMSNKKQEFKIYGK